MDWPVLSFFTNNRFTWLIHTMACRLKAASLCRYFLVHFADWETQPAKVSREMACKLFAGQWLLASYIGSLIHLNKEEEENFLKHWFAILISISVYCNSKYKIAIPIILQTRLLYKWTVYKPHCPHPSFIKLLFPSLQRKVWGVSTSSIVCREDKDRVLIQTGGLQGSDNLVNTTVQGLGYVSHKR